MGNALTAFFLMAGGESLKFIGGLVLAYCHGFYADTLFC